MSHWGPLDLRSGLASGATEEHSLLRSAIQPVPRSFSEGGSRMAPFKKEPAGTAGDTYHWGPTRLQLGAGQWRYMKEGALRLLRQTCHQGQIVIDL